MTAECSGRRSGMLVLFCVALIRLVLLFVGTYLFWLVGNLIWIAVVFYAVPMHISKVGVPFTITELQPTIT